MAYTNYYECSPIFFDEQNLRMRETLQNNPLLQNFRFKMIEGDVNISGTESWPLTGGFPPSGNAYITGNLIVNPGAVLNIQSGRIQFNPSSKITIRQGGLLNLNGSTLTSWCDYWQGVEVLGNSAAPQFPTTHGKFTSSENLGLKPRIENAIVGVKSLDGGIVLSYNTIFSNNLT
jgi:hypothetical protein